MKTVLTIDSPWLFDERYESHWPEFYEHRRATVPAPYQAGDTFSDGTIALPSPWERHATATACGLALIVRTVRH